MTLNGSDFHILLDSTFYCNYNCGIYWNVLVRDPGLRFQKKDTLFAVGCLVFVLKKLLSCFVKSYISANLAID